MLGDKMFGIRDEDGEDFARRQNAGGFFHPQQHSTKQQPWDQQVSVTYLLGLDASVPQALQEVRQREKALGELRKAARGGALGPIIGKASDLRTKLAVQDAKVEKLRAQLATFQVVPQYREYEQEASRLSTELAKLANENTIDIQTIRHLEDAVCFDMMLLELCMRRGLGPGLLIHDSHLFDGVDERQVARALEIGAARAEKLGFQYIVTLNEDAIPRSAMRPDFPFDSHVNPVRLTDATDVGGLFGLRFE